MANGGGSITGAKEVPVSESFDRAAEYERIVALRKKCELCSGLRNPATLGFDSAEIGPWTRWLGDLRAKLMIVGQDWGGLKYYKENKGLDDCTDPDYRTNRKLQCLLKGIGIDVPSAARENIPHEIGVFLTNAVLCIKKGGNRAPVAKRYFSNCRSFLRHQIEIVLPDVVVTLGAPAYSAAMSVFGMREKRMLEAVETQEVVELTNGHRFCFLPVYHPRASITNEQQKRGWKRVKRALARSHVVGRTAGHGSGV